MQEDRLRALANLDGSLQKQDSDARIMLTIDPDSCLHRRAKQKTILEQDLVHQTCQG